MEDRSLCRDGIISWARITADHRLRSLQPDTGSWHFQITDAGIMHGVYARVLRSFCHYSLPAGTESRRRLRSASSTTLDVRRTRLSTVGDRAFPVAAAHLWNSLPSHVTAAPSLSIFCCRLKSHLFSPSYPAFAFWLFSHLYSARARDLSVWIIVDR